MNSTMFNRKAHRCKSARCLYFFLLLFAACHKAPTDIEPKVNYIVQDRYLKELPSPFPPLSAKEKEEPWGREYLIGIHFAHKLDLYPAITAFKRAEILLPENATTRKLEVNYEILLCYYLGQKYQEVIATFEETSLRMADPSFPAFHDLLIILYDSCSQAGEEEKAERIRAMICHYYPEEGEKLALSTALQHADMQKLPAYALENPQIHRLLSAYEEQKKSVATAKWLNAALPGAGYWYLGQQQSALTAFLLNGLFIAASVHFFQQGNIPAGAIFTSFEAGWYFGGIQGGGLEAKYYNERLYERLATPFMNQEKLFPVFMLSHSF